VDAAEPVSRHRRIFDEMLRHSYSEERSVLLLQARVAALPASIDR
jgi:hypothetical protein